MCYMLCCSLCFFTSIVVINVRHSISLPLLSYSPSSGSFFCNGKLRHIRDGCVGCYTIRTLLFLFAFAFRFLRIIVVFNLWCLFLIVFLFLFRVRFSLMSSWWFRFCFWFRFAIIVNRNCFDYLLVVNSFGYRMLFFVIRIMLLSLRGMIDRLYMIIWSFALFFFILAFSIERLLFSFLFTSTFFSFSICQWDVRFLFIVHVRLGM